MQDSRYYPVSIAMKIGHISHRQALAWAKDETLVPSRIYVTDHRPYTLLYSFTDLVALRVISVLREQHGLPLQDARLAANYLRNHPDVPWDQLQIWVVDKRIRTADPGEESAARIDLTSIAEEVRTLADRLWQRDPATFGKVEYRRDVMGGTLVVKGTRVSVATVVNMTAQGANEEEILDAYPSLVPEDIRGVLAQVAEQRKVA